MSSNGDTKDSEIGTAQLRKRWGLEPICRESLSYAHATTAHARSPTRACVAVSAFFVPPPPRPTSQGAQLRARRVYAWTESCTRRTERALHWLKSHAPQELIHSSFVNHSSLITDSSSTHHAFITCSIIRSSLILRGQCLAHERSHHACFAASVMVTPHVVSHR